MSVQSLLKSPLVLSGVGLISTGGLGVGSWQIYEELNPTLSKKLSREGYSYQPIKAPNEEQPSNAKFKWSSWDCIKRLFPGVEVKHELTNTTNSLPTSSLSSLNKDEKNFIVCAIMEMRPVSSNSGESKTFKNRIYAKSEVVIKGQNYGWIIWTGITTVPQKDNSDQGDLDLTYRLLELKKDGGNWAISGGLGWYDAKTNSSDGYIVIAPPTKNQEGWFTKKNPRYYSKTPKNSSDADFKAKSWAGIGEVDNSGVGGHLLSSISMNFQNCQDEDAEDCKNTNKDKELWGSNGEFSDKGFFGYTYGRYFYEQNKNDGWQHIKTNEKHQPKSNDISSKLNKWYAPFKNKKIKWTTLEDKCNTWFKERNKNLDNNKDLVKICYQ